MRLSRWLSLNQFRNRSQIQKSVQEVPGGFLLFLVSGQPSAGRELGDAIDRGK